MGEFTWNLIYHTFIEYFNFAMFILFALMYSYQIVYMFVAFKAKRNKKSGTGECSTE